MAFPMQDTERHSEDEFQNVVDSCKPSSKMILPGDEGIYTEGIVKGRVKVLAVRDQGDMIEYDLETLEQLSRFPLPKTFTCGKQRGYEGWCGWSLKV